MIDTHCHLTFEQLENDIDAVLQRSTESGVDQCITVGTDTDQNKKAVQLAQKYSNVYAAVGIHPHYAKDITAKDIDALQNFAAQSKVVAVGETGFDFHYNFSPPDQQKALFIEHIKLAEKLNLPLIIHSRNAFDETMQVLNDHARNIKKVVFHCFGEAVEQAKLILDKGYNISFTGVVTFKSAETTRQVVRNTPAERIMLETDCPYMSPAPMRKQKINEPALMIHTAKFIAELKDMDFKAFDRLTTQTSKEFFALT